MSSDLSARHMVRTLRRMAIRQTCEFLVRRCPDISSELRSALNSWLLQIVRRHPALSHGLIRRVVLRILQTLSAESDPLPFHGIRDCLRYTMRILAKDGDETTCRDVMQVLRQASGFWFAGLQEVHARAVERFRNRRDAAVSTRALSGHIVDFVRYVSHVTGHPVAPVRFDAVIGGDRVFGAAEAARSEIRAYCDGHTLHLPPWTAIARFDSTAEMSTSEGLEQSRELNALFAACYLTLHEFLHLALGSWKFSFQSRRGKLLFRRLRPWRNNWKARQSSGLSQELRDKLRSEGIFVEKLESQTQPDLVRLWQHFPNPQLAQWLFNAVEDGRIESTVERRWPGLWQIHRVVQTMHADEVARTSVGDTHLQSLVNAVGMLAADRVMRVTLPRDYLSVLDKARRIVARQKRLPRRSVYDSILTTLKLYQLLEQATREAESEDELKGFRPGVDSEEIAVRMQLADRQDDKSLYDNSKHGRDGDFDVKSPGIWLPEWNGRTRIEQKTHVSLHSLAVAERRTQLPDLMMPFPALNLQRKLFSKKGTRRWHDAGRFLAYERLALASAWQSLGGNPYPIHFDPESKRVPVRITMLLDLSASMEAPRHCLGGDNPLDRAIQGASWMARHLENLGVEVVAYGACDGGPRLCRLYRLPQPVSHSMKSVRGIGAAGFRMGAFIRAFSRSPAVLGMKPFVGRDILMIFTDTDRHYLSLSNESIFEKLHKSNCVTCASRHRCSVEAGDGAVQPRPNELGWLFMPPRYELEDVDDAVNDSSGSEVVINYFGPQLPFAGARQTNAVIHHCNSTDIWPDVIRSVFLQAPFPMGNRVTFNTVPVSATPR